MKKIFAIILLIACLFVMTSCGNQATQESNEYSFFVKITEFSTFSKGLTELFYDPFTKVVYVGVVAGYNAGLSPYYIIKNGEPVIARYGVNWTEANLK